MAFVFSFRDQNNIDFGPPRRGQINIITAILDGRQPVQLTARHRMRGADLPMEWQQQRQFLGFT